jgi:hypothetical protein
VRVNQNQQRALLAGRVVWTAVLLFQVWALFSVATARPNPVNETPPGGWDAPTVAAMSRVGLHPKRRQVYVCLGLAVVVMVLGHGARTQTYKRYWRQHRIAPRGYLLGNVILWCGCAGAAGLVYASGRGPLWMTTLPAVAVVGVHLIQFPNGRAMEPAVPVFGRSL